MFTKKTQKRREGNLKRFFHINHFIFISELREMFEGYLSCHYGKLKLCNQQTGNTISSLIYDAIKFKGCGEDLISTHSSLADFLGIGIAKLKMGIKRLLDCNLIQKSRFYINQIPYLKFFTEPSSEDPIVNYRRLKVLKKHTGSYYSSLILGYISYRLRMFSTMIDGVPCLKLMKKWIQDMCSIFFICEHTVTRYLEKLWKGGFLVKKKRESFGVHEVYYGIDVQMYNKLSDELMVKKKPEDRFGFHDKAKTDLTNLLDNNTLEKRYINNNTGDINSKNLEKIGNELTVRQEIYLQEACKRTTQQEKPDSGLLSQLRYAILSPEQRKNVSGFKHMVNRCMKLVREGVWKIPFGYNKYSKEGKMEWDNILQREKKGLAYKTTEELERLKCGADERMRQNEKSNQTFAKRYGGDVDDEKSSQCQSFSQTSSRYESFSNIPDFVMERNLAKQNEKIKRFEAKHGRTPTWLELLQFEA